MRQCRGLYRHACVSSCASASLNLKAGTKEIKSHSSQEKISFETNWGTWTYTSPWDLMRCPLWSWGSWQIQSLSHSPLQHMSHCKTKTIKSKPSGLHQLWSQNLICIMYLFLAAPFPLTGKMEERMTLALILFVCIPRALSSFLTSSRFQFAVSFAPAWKNNNG